MKYFFSLIFLISAFSLCKAQKVKPALHLITGTTYYMRSTAHSENIQIANGRKIKLNLTLAFRLAFKVTAANDSLYFMEVSYQALNMKMQAGELGIEMNSEKKDSLDIASQIIKAMMNKPFNITITRSGKVRSVNNVENMIEGAFDSFPKIEAGEKIQLKNQFIQTFGAKALKGNLEICTAIFPESPVARNDTWLVNTKIESITTADLQTTYQLIDATGISYQIHGEGTINNDQDAGVTIMDGQPVKYKLSGTTLIDIKADKATGWVSELKLRQLIKGSVDLPDNAKTPGGLTIPMIIKMEQTTTE